MLHQSIGNLENSPVGGPKVGIYVERFVFLFNSTICYIIFTSRKIMAHYVLYRIWFSLVLHRVCIPNSLLWFSAFLTAQFHEISVDGIRTGGISNTSVLGDNRFSNKTGRLCGLIKSTGNFPLSPSGPWWAGYLQFWESLYSFVAKAKRLLNCLYIFFHFEIIILSFAVCFTDKLIFMDDFHITRNSSSARVIL